MIPKKDRFSYAVLFRALSAFSVLKRMRDSYTHGHQKRVATIACLIGAELGLPKEQIRDCLRIAGILHDVGKLRIPAAILHTAGPLREVERAVIREHPTDGHAILEKIHFPWPVARVVLQHHERYDGSGYPHGLRKDDILLDARILAVADVFEAMSSHRPYRPAFGLDAALSEINNARGQLYCPECAAAFGDVYRRKKRLIEKLFRMRMA